MVERYLFQKYFRAKMLQGTVGKWERELFLASNHQKYYISKNFV